MVAYILVNKLYFLAVMFSFNVLMFLNSTNAHRSVRRDRICKVQIFTKPSPSVQDYSDHTFCSLAAVFSYPAARSLLKLLSLVRKLETNSKIVPNYKIESKNCTGLAL